MTNATRDNEIVRYRRGADGSLTRVGRTSTRGLGIGVDLDTQGPLRLSADRRYLYAVNAGSDDVSVFRVDGTRLRFVQKVPAGDQPVSLTVHRGLLYVLNGSVAGNGIRGFRRADNGRLRPIPRSVQLLSSPIAVPGDIEFSPNGRVIAVSQKTTANTLSPKIALDLFAVNRAGVVGPPSRQRSHGVRPFAVAFADDRTLLSAEAFDAAMGRSAVSSYRVNGRNLAVTSGSVRNRQTDSCWIVVTDDGRFAYVANFGSGTISSYRIAPNGAITLQQGRAAVLGMKSQPVDLALTADSDYLYLLLRGSGAVAQFRVGESGGLQRVGVVRGGLPVAGGASGLAVY